MRHPNGQVISEAPVHTHPVRHSFSLKARLMLGFGVILGLMLCMALFCASRLAVIHDYNRSLDERALRLSLANEWATQAQVAQAKGAPHDASALVSKLNALVKAPEEQKPLQAVLAAQSQPDALVDTLKTLTGELVRLQIADSGALQAASQAAAWMLGGLSAVAMLAGVALAAWTIRSITQGVGQALAATERIADGELYHPIHTQRDDELGTLLQSLARMRERLQATLGQVRHAADNIHLASGEIASGNADLSQRTEATASNLQATASAMDQLTGTVRHSADSAATAKQLAGSAAEVAQRGGTVVAEVVSTMDEITNSSKKIADIIGVIDGIAFQTNILALNAAVEAARAGEQGRGFAVVASEVRSLAQRSAEAAKEIKGLIGSSVDKVETGARLVQTAGGTMGEIVASVQRVSDIIGEISAAAQEQSQGLGQVNGAVNQLDSMTQQNAALVEQSSAAAMSLREQASQLASAMGAFRLTA
jgi:methyl-accepting chemotaxis protein